MDEQNFCACQKKWGDRSGCCGFCKKRITGAIDWRALYRQYHILRIMREFTEARLRLFARGAPFEEAVHAQCPDSL